MRKTARFVPLGLALTLVGCGYLADRGRDAMDMVDFGFTTSKKFCFGIYQDYFNLIPHGYSRIEGQFHGLGARRFGSVPIHDRTWGLFLWGSREKRLGKFDPRERRQFSQRKRKELEAAGKPLPTEVPRYHTGALAMACKDKVPPKATFFT